MTTVMSSVADADATKTAAMTAMTVANATETATTVATAAATAAAMKTTATDADGNLFNFEYLAEVGASNAGLSSATGTVSVAIEENNLLYKNHE